MVDYMAEGGGYVNPPPKASVSPPAPERRRWVGDVHRVSVVGRIFEPGIEVCGRWACPSIRPRHKAGSWSLRASFQLLGSSALLRNKLGKPRDQARNMTVEEVGDRGLVYAGLEQHLWGHDFGEANPWIGQAGRPVNIGRPSAR